MIKTMNEVLEPYLFWTGDPSPDLSHISGLYPQYQNMTFNKEDLKIIPKLKEACTHRSKLSGKMITELGTEILVYVQPPTLAMI